LVSITPGGLRIPTAEFKENQKGFPSLPIPFCVGGTLTLSLEFPLGVGEVWLWSGHGLGQDQKGFPLGRPRSDRGTRRKAVAPCLGTTLKRGGGRMSETGKFYYTSVFQSFEGGWEEGLEKKIKSYRMSGSAGL